MPVSTENRNPSHLGKGPNITPTPLGGAALADLFSLEDVVAVVTGGSRGIGRMIAEGFVVAGARVVITARSADECEAAAAEMRSWGDCRAIAADLSTVSGIDDFSKRLLEMESRIDVLVNNAGAAWGDSFETFPESGWDKVVDLNLKTPFFLTQRLFPALRRSDDEQPAKVINITSIDGLTLGQHETYSYHASKAGLIHLTRRMAARLVGEGIVVNSIAPGAFASQMNKEARDDEETHSRIIPARRIGSPADIAASAIYLAARAGDYVVGQTLVVDGGVTNTRRESPVESTAPAVSSY